MSTGMACQECGVPVSAGARFCMNCGADVSSEQGNVATRKFTSTQAMHDQLLARLRHAALGDHEILTELGRGGMATVYLAHDIQLDRKVAIKVMLPALIEGDDMVERFRLEARTAAALSHPHIIPIFAVRASEGLVYFVMKFVEGRPLDAIIKELGQLPVPMVRSILSKVGEALGYAHRRGVVHRDIKPANLMIDVEGQPVVTDFGIAKVADSRGLTMTGAMMGTPTYMSPEQCSAGEITGASDQYSLGVVAYQMLGGRVPFEGDTLVGLLYKHCHETPPPLLQARPDCPPQLAAAVMRMLEKDPAKRFPTMDAAVEAIGAVSLAYDDPIRTQLMGLAKRGENVSLLKRISTPSSPVPLRKPSGMAKRATAPLAPREATVGVPTTTERRRPVAAYVGGAALVVVIGVLAWLKPWAGPADVPTSPAVASIPPAPEKAGGQPAADSNPTVGEAPVSAPPSTSTVTAAEADAVTSLRVQSVREGLQVGERMTLRAVPLDARGRTLSPRSVRWTVSEESFATISANGEIVARAPGRVTVTARLGTVSSPPFVIQIGPARATYVSVSAPPASLEVGQTATLTVTALDASRQPVAGAISWRTSDPGVARVDDGVVRAMGPGRTTVSASVDGQVAEVPVVVVPAPVAASPVNTPPREESTPHDSVLIRATVQRYARAFERKQLVELRETFPTMTTESENSLSDMFRRNDSLKVVMSAATPVVTGAEGRAVVTVRYDFYENRQHTPLIRRQQWTFVRGPSGWLIKSIADIR